MKPTLQQFEIFMSVAKRGGFTLAANHLGLSKSAVSHHIRLLEKSMHVPLFIRTTRTVRLTDEGQLLLKQCEKIQQELECAQHLVSQFDSQPTGILKINCNPYLAETHLLEPLQSYLTQYPNIQVEMSAEERMPDMQLEQIDLLFGVNWPAPLDVVAKTIGKTRYVICASPSYLKKHGTPKDIKALEQHNYIPHMGRSPENIIADLKKPVQLKLSPRLKLNHASTMKSAALQGMGIVQLHNYMIEDELASGRLIDSPYALSLRKPYFLTPAWRSDLP